MSGPSLFGGDGVAMARAEDVIPFLGMPGHWREGRSAYETAHSWFDCAGSLPPAIAGLLATDPALAGATLLRATFEKQTRLDDLGRPSQTDVLAEVLTPSGPAILAVEAKVDETFGPTVAEWRANGSPGRQARLAGLCARLGLAPDAVAALRYQLLHRSAAALIEAEAHAARDAVLVVQSFSAPELRAGFPDFRAFTATMGVPVAGPGRLSAPVERGSVRLRFGWAQDAIRARRGAT
jgi:hypothetical protein